MFILVHIQLRKTCKFLIYFEELLFFLFLHLEKANTRNKSNQIKTNLMRFYVLIIAVIAITSSLFGQSPGGFNYQAIVRDANSKVVASQSVGIQISIKQGSASGPSVYQETFSPLTNDYGLINLEVGTGSVESGSFSAIDWAHGPYFMETAMDLSGGTNYMVMGASQLRSVPYALFAGTAENITQKSFDVGEWANGGVIFYVNKDGTHGLVAATDDQATNISWYNANDNLNNPRSHDEDGGSYMDWRLPTKYELELMFQRKSMIGNFTRYIYWSSIEADNGQVVWTLNFNDGQELISDKTSKGSVRLVRVF